MAYRADNLFNVYRNRQLNGPLPGDGDAPECYRAETRLAPFPLPEWSTLSHVVKAGSALPCWLIPLSFAAYRSNYPGAITPEL